MPFCPDPGCTGIHTHSHGRRYADLCPAAKKRASTRQRASRARRMRDDPAYAAQQAGRLATLTASRDRARQARRAERAQAPLPDAQRCAYPGCARPRGGGADLCTKYHCRAHDGEPDGTLNENDGIVDWVAVEIAATGERRVGLTWVERDLAIAMALGSGEPCLHCAERGQDRPLCFYEAAVRAGLPVTGEDDPRLRGAKFRRLAALGRRYFDRAHARADAA